MGGEKQMEQGAGRLWVGSPPHGRGKAEQCLMSKKPARITPAWAGKRRSADKARRFERDHPRVGGEKLLPSDTLFLELGSPPRGRGKANRHSVPSCFTGITPAWAGKRRFQRFGP